jgi:hypothetical protein
MAYISAGARQQLLDALGDATDKIGEALASLGAAYEQLDTYASEKLEDELFRPVQLAYGRARRTHAGFAERHSLQGRRFEPTSAGLRSTGVKGFLDSAVEAVGEADRALAQLQDSMMPVEVGDADLRAGLAEVRELVAGLRPRAHQLVRTLGR